MRDNKTFQISRLKAIRDMACNLGFLPMSLEEAVSFDMAVAKPYIFRTLFRNYGFMVRSVGSIQAWINTNANP